MWKTDVRLGPRPSVATSATVLLLGSLFAGCGSDANVGDAGPLGDSAILADADVADAALDAALDASAPGEPRLADGITLTGVELFQSVEIPLMQGGTASPPGAAPVVAARDAMVRVYAAPTGGAVTVTAEIELGSVGGPTTTLRATQTIDAPSTTADPTSTFNLLVPAASVTPDAQYRVRLVAPDGTPAATGVMHDARYPRDGSTAPLGAQDDMGGVELVLVPVRYNYDGSGRLPDTSAAQLDLFRSLLLAVYPLSQVTITVRDPIDWSDGPQLFTGNFDFGQLNRYLQDLKTTDGAPSASYYYALVQPGPTFSAYCGGSCTTGQSFVVGNPADGDQRVGGGMGYSGERWAWTLAHELGHMHGRSHAPCNVGSSDPSYPYGGGAIGVWGYDPRADAYFDPTGPVRSVAGTVEMVGHVELEGGEHRVEVADGMRRQTFDRTDVTFQARDGVELLAAGFAAPTSVEQRLSYGNSGPARTLELRARLPSTPGSWRKPALAGAALLLFLAALAVLVSRLKARGSESAPTDTDAD